ncbi:MAG: ATP-binding cassette domain-containing protein [Clostridia bacterium]|nr:ATP-binding cassette domain-containing protein [Clostridia bacterium]
MSENKNREILLSVKDLTVQFGKKRKPFTAVDKVSFDIYKGETFGLVGESGSGKTTIGRAVIRVAPTAGGDILYNGEKINGKISKDLDKSITRKIQMIFQDSMEKALKYCCSIGIHSSKNRLRRNSGRL